MQTVETLEITLKIKKNNGANTPEYKTQDAAGCDLEAFLESPVTLKPLERTLIPTGLFFEIPTGYEIQIRPRSGLAFKHGITVLNAPGTIDADYRGEIKVLLVNLSNEPFTIEPGMRIAQMVVAQANQCHFVEEEVLSETARGSGGFGHTGK